MKRKQQLEVGEGGKPPLRIFKQSSNYTFNCNGPGLSGENKICQDREKNYLKFRHNENC